MEGITQQVSQMGTTLSPGDLNNLIQQAAQAQSQSMSHTIAITVCFVLGVIVILLYVVYATLIMKKNKVKEALAGIDVQLKKRYDLITNILFMANKYMEHERSLMEDITNLRTEAVKTKTNIDNIADKIKLDNEIQNKMGQLMVSVENYPQLKSNETMVQAMATYSEVEEHISAARRFYNSAVLALNNAVEILPSKWFADRLGIKSTLPYFEITEVKERESIDAKTFFK